MIHPHTEVRFINENIGYGLVAIKLIPKGTITWVQDELDTRYTAEEIKEMKVPVQEMVEKYGFRNSKGEYVLCWDNAKYVNHSFKSNCISTAYDFEIAVRDILPGEQLTDDYGYLNISEPFEAEDEGTDRCVVYPDDLLHYHKEWDELVAKAMENFEDVQQPLFKFLNSKIQDKMKAVAQKKEQMASILDCYYPEED